MRALRDGHPSTRWQRAAAAAWAVALACLAGSAMADEAAQREARIKAALVFKIVKFVDWPAGTFGAGVPVRICTLGDSPVAQALSAVDGKPVRDRSAQIVRLGSAPGDAAACHLLYVAPTSRDAVAGLQAALRGRAVLTVSDLPDFARRGGMIGMERDENRIAFEINLRAAREAGLAPAAPLLELARVVE